ncbi:MAG: hypothetical protein WAM71_02385 [Candidatus Korobacteraceae bacterium]
MIDAKPRLRFIIGFVSLLLFVTLWGCRHASETTELIEQVNDLREAFNKGSCKSIYAEADPAFRTQSEESWASQCVELRHQLGNWKSFHQGQPDEKSSDSRFHLVIGEAMFTNGNYHLETYWNVSGSRSRLCYLQIGTDPDLITAPPMKWRGPEEDAPKLPPSG